MAGPVKRNGHVAVCIRQLPNRLAADPSTALASPRRVRDLNVGYSIEHGTVQAHTGVGVDYADATYPTVYRADELNSIVASLCDINRTSPGLFDRVCWCEGKASCLPTAGPADA